jgi:hypothetical protein
MVRSIASSAALGALAALLAIPVRTGGWASRGLFNLPAVWQAHSGS